MASSSRQLSIIDSPISIHQVDLTKPTATNFARRCVGCLVLTHDGKILLQQRDQDCHTFPGYLGTFGGGIDTPESPMQALVRELQEELGAHVNPVDVISLGAITEGSSNHSELLYVYIWHDKQGTITGCYEGKAIYYDNYDTPLLHPKIMDDVRWLLKECQRLELV